MAEKGIDISENTAHDADKSSDMEWHYVIRYLIMPKKPELCLTGQLKLDRYRILRPV